MRNRHGARMALLTGVVAFLGIQMVLDGVFDGMWSPFYNQKVNGVRKALREVSDGHTVLMVGSSRTTHGLMGGVVQSLLSRELGQRVLVYNMGMPGDGPVMNLLTLRRLLDDGIRPEFLLVEVLPGLLLDGDRLPGDIGELHLATESMRYAELSFVRHYSRAKRSVSTLDWWWRHLSPSYHLRKQLLTILQPRLLRQKDLFEKLHQDALGWVPIYSPMTAPDKKPLALAAAYKQYSDQLERSHPNQSSVEALEELLKLCQHEQIRVALVLMPEGPVFRSWYSPEVLSWIHNLLDDLSHRYSVPVIDAREWVNREEDFLDSHHLLPSGAATFSRRLGEEVLPPLLRSLQ